MTHKLRRTSERCDYPSPEAWERIRAALEAIVQREQAKDEKEAEHGAR